MHEHRATCREPENAHCHYGERGCADDCPVCDRLADQINAAVWEDAVTNGEPWALGDCP